MTLVTVLWLDKIVNTPRDSRAERNNVEADLVMVCSVRVREGDLMMVNCLRLLANSWRLCAADLITVHLFAGLPNSWRG
jgi:hypothetical protein